MSVFLGLRAGSKGILTWDGLEWKGCPGWLRPPWGGTQVREKAPQQQTAVGAGGAEGFLKDVVPEEVPENPQESMGAQQKGRKTKASQGWHQLPHALEHRLAPDQPTHSTTAALDLHQATSFPLESRCYSRQKHQQTHPWGPHFLTCRPQQIHCLWNLQTPWLCPAPTPAG